MTTADRVDFSTRAKEILRQGYSRHSTPQPTGNWVAEIREIPNCYAQGKTQAETLLKLENHALELISFYLRMDREIPPPNDGEFSGHFALRIPPVLHRRAAMIAQDNRTSLNQFFVYAISRCVGEVDAATSIAARISQSITFEIKKVIYGTAGPTSPGGWPRILDSTVSQRFEFNPAPGSVEVPDAAN
jgi:antitoxin HicB